MILVLRLKDKILKIYNHLKLNCVSHDFLDIVKPKRNSEICEKVHLIDMKINVTQIPFFQISLKQPQYFH